MPDADQRGRPHHDLAQQLVRLEALEQLDGRLVHGREVEVARRVVGRPAGPCRRLRQVERAVGRGHEGVLAGAVLGVEGDAHAGGDRGPERAGERGDRGADPVRDLPGPRLAHARHEDRELVAAVPEDEVAVAHRLGHRMGDPGQQRVARRVAVRVVVGLERVEVQHQQCERPRPADPFAQLPLERAVVPEARQRVVRGLGDHGAVCLGVAERDRRLGREELDQLELVPREVRLDAAHARHVERADHLARDEQRADDHRFRLLGRAGDLDRAGVHVGVVGQDRLAVADRPARDADIQRALVGHDQLREPVPGDDGPPDPGHPVHAVDRQRVVGHDRLERVRDHLENARRVQRRQQALVDLQQPALALQAVGKLLPLPVHLVERLGVDHGLGGEPGEDLQGPLVVLTEPVDAGLRHDDHAHDARVPGHGHQQHRLGAAQPTHLEKPRVRLGIAQAEGPVVEGDPSGQPLADPDPELLRGRPADPHELALERDRLAGLGDVVHAIDTDGVVADQAVRLRNDGLADPLHVLDAVQARRELLDGAEAGSTLADGAEEAGIRDGGRHPARERGAQLQLVGRPVVR